jgi:hypothetical protein
MCSMKILMLELGLLLAWTFLKYNVIHKCKEPQVIRYNSKNDWRAVRINIGCITSASWRSACYQSLGFQGSPDRPDSAASARKGRVNTHFLLQRAPNLCSCIRLQQTLLKLHKQPHQCFLRTKSLKVNGETNAKNGHGRNSFLQSSCGIQNDTS